ncbi:hypothetical protein [Mycolicibacterium sediminis]|uniref:Uncharacterized protein n=1 Tax=Mycolicibacterium sediminis TaxID=1286180 RepID=A0A7I7QMM2_9MYCO|nr:hypothetical protein [Mycolicibacterium sediminis]BBY27542.1 hypothetical protein MSEDJ_16380 [Mycolicibacterium sediminis]
MDLRWPLLLVLVVVAIGVVGFLAIKRTRHGWQGELPLLARSYRLTSLPEYQRALRLHERVSAAALVVSIVATAALIGATARPTWTYDPRADDTNTPHVDIMLCFGPGSSLYGGTLSDLRPLFETLGGIVETFGNQRIGMTNSLYRAFPMTADREWVAERFGEIVGVMKEVDAPKNGYDYVDRLGYFEAKAPAYGSGPPAFTPTVLDTLAMCATGLPAVGSDNGRGRMILYFGDAELPDDPGTYTFSFTPPAATPLFSKATLEDTVKTAGIQVNAVVPEMSTQPLGFVEKLVGDTGGQHIEYTQLSSEEAADRGKADKQQEEISKAVEKILDNPPPSALDQVQQSAALPFDWDVPDLLLQLALVASIALAALRWGMRL